MFAEALQRLQPPVEEMQQLVESDRPRKRLRADAGSGASEVNGIAEPDRPGGKDAQEVGPPCFVPTLQ